MNRKIRKKKSFGIDRKLIIFILIAIFAVIFAIFANESYRYSKMSQATLDIYNSNYSKESVESWKDQAEEFFQQDISAYDLLKLYIEKSKTNSVLKLEPISIEEEHQIEKDIEYSTTTENDENFLNGFSYTMIEGNNGSEEYVNVKLKIKDRVSDNLEYFKRRVTEPQNKLERQGKLLEDNFKELITTNSEKLILSLENSDEANFKLLTNGVELKDMNTTNLLTITKNKDFEINIIVDEKELDEYVSLGNIIFDKPACSLEIIYNKNTSKYHFIGLSDFYDRCKKNILPSTTSKPTKEIALDCSDCSLAPVDKIYKLPKAYVPQIVPTNLSGGGYMTIESRDQLSKLFTAAKSSGINIVIASSYRSYNTQVNTFQSWVNSEIAKGYSKAQAEERANTYSARPGHSEHQLGTTVDLRCATCKAFDNSQGNIAMYTFLEQNAYKYGFIISYPKNTQSLTGYVYEPWHIRYIGIELATEFWQTEYYKGNGNYLQKFLLERWK